MLWNTRLEPLALRKRRRVILWYVKEVNVFIQGQSRFNLHGESLAIYSQEVWRDLLDRVL